MTEEKKSFVRTFGKPATEENMAAHFEDVTSFRRVKYVKKKNGKETLKVEVGFEFWLSPEYIEKVVESGRAKRSEP